MHPANPAWGDLGEDLWLRVCRALRFDHRAGAAWVERCRTLAAVSGVCSSLRSVVLGPHAAALWQDLSFRSAYAGLMQVGCPPAALTSSRANTDTAVHAGAVSSPE